MKRFDIYPAIAFVISFATPCSSAGVVNATFSAAGTAAVPSSGYTATGSTEFRMVVDDAGATYPITVDPIAQQAYLKASNTDAAKTIAASFGTELPRAQSFPPY